MVVMHLCNAAQQGDIAEIERLLTRYGAPRNGWHWCVIRAASKQGHFDTVKYLYSRGFPICQFTTASDAVKLGHLEMLEYVLTQTQASRPNEHVSACINAVYHATQRLVCFKYLLHSPIVIPHIQEDTVWLFKCCVESSATFAAFEYFHSWCELSKLQTCWELVSVSENMIAAIDLDNMIWRHVMMKLELSEQLVATNPSLCQNIQRLHERQEACLSAVQSFVSNDVIQHILFDYVTLK